MRAREHVKFSEVARELCSTGLREKENVKCCVVAGNVVAYGGWGKRNVSSLVKWGRELGHTMLRGREKVKFSQHII